MEMVNIKINGMPVSVPAGTTILEAATYAGIRNSHPVLSEGNQRDRRLPHLRGRSRRCAEAWSPPAFTR